MAVLFCRLFVFLLAFCAALAAETDELVFEKGEFCARKVNEIIANEIRALSNEGYPFAQISPEIQEEDEQKIRVKLDVKKGVFVENVRLRFVIDGKLREYLVQKPTAQFFDFGGENEDENVFYRQENVEAARRVLQNKRYVRNVRVFAPQKSEAGDFYALPIAVSAQTWVFFSGGLGISNAGSATTAGGAVVVGNAALDIVNAMGFGEAVEFSYVGEELFYKISANLEVPYFLKTPFGLLFSADAEIGDSLYGTVALSAGIQYFFRKSWTANLLAQYRELSKEDSVSRYGGVQIALQNAKRPFRRSQKTSQFSFELESGVLYSQNDQMPKADFLAKAAFHIPVKQTRFAYLLKPNAGAIAYKVPENLHSTQMFRLGGANSVRGYQENVFACLAFASAGSDFRFYIDDYSALYLLADYAAMTENEYSAKNLRQIFGYGLGISLPLRRFVFSLEWARNIKDVSNFGRLHFRFSPPSGAP